MQNTLKTASFFVALCIGSALANSPAPVACDVSIWSCGFRYCKAAPVQCSNGSEGFISHQNTQLSSLKVVVTTKTGRQKIYTLPNPPGKLTDYYNDLEDNDWVLSKIPLLERIDKIEVAKHGYGIPAQTDLYQAAFLEQKKGVVGESKKDGLKCIYNAPPKVTNMKRCGAVCMGNGACDINGKTYTDVNFVCKAKKGSACPKADDCGAEDIDTPLLMIASNYDTTNKANYAPPATGTGTRANATSPDSSYSVQ